MNEHLKPSDRLLLFIVYLTALMVRIELRDPSLSILEAWYKKNATSIREYFGALPPIPQGALERLDRETPICGNYEMLCRICSRLFLEKPETVFGILGMRNNTDLRPLIYHCIKVHTVLSLRDDLFRQPYPESLCGRIVDDRSSAKTLLLAEREIAGRMYEQYSVMPKYAKQAKKLMGLDRKSMFSLWKSIYGFSFANKNTISQNAKKIKEDFKRLGLVEPEPLLQAYFLSKICDKMDPSDRYIESPYRYLRKVYGVTDEENTSAEAGSPAHAFYVSEEVVNKAVNKLRPIEIIPFLATVYCEDRYREVNVENRLVYARMAQVFDGTDGVKAVIDANPVLCAKMYRLRRKRNPLSVFLQNDSAAL